MLSAGSLIQARVAQTHEFRDTAASDVHKDPCFHFEGKACIPTGKYSSNTLSVFLNLPKKCNWLKNVTERVFCKNLTRDADHCPKQESKNDKIGMLIFRPKAA